MVFHQYIVACEANLMETNDTITATATYTDPFTYEETSVTHTATIAELLAADADQLIKGDAIVVYAEALKKIAHLIYSDPQKALSTCRQAREQVEEAAALLGDEELADIAELLAIYEETIENYSGW